MTASELQNARNRLGLTKAEMARRIGLTWRHYHRLEQGDVEITRTVELLVESLLH